MAEEGSQRDPDPGVCRGFAEAMQGYGAWVMTGTSAHCNWARGRGGEDAVGSKGGRACEERL